MSTAENILGDSSDAGDKQYLTFELSGTCFGIDILPIKEIIEYQNLTEVPLVPSFVSGVINLRGSVVPVISLSERLKLESYEKTNRTCIVVAELEFNNEKVTMGLIVDKVLQVIDVSQEKLKDRPQFGASIDSRFIDKMAEMDDFFLIVLKIDNLISPEEIKIMHEVSEGE